MDKYIKNFDDWNEKAKQIELTSRNHYLKCGAIHWVAFGINIGSEYDGKDINYTRPGLILNLYGDNLALVAPITTKKKVGTYTRRIYVTGMPETLILDQIRIIDRKRILDFLEEISDEKLFSYRRTLARLITNPPKIKEDLAS